MFKLLEEYFFQCIISLVRYSKPPLYYFDFKFKYCVLELANRLRKLFLKSSFFFFFFIKFITNGISTLYLLTVIHNFILTYICSSHENKIVNISFSY